MSAEIVGGSKLEGFLAAVAKRLGGNSGPELSVGFMEGAGYPDGTPVAAVAFWNEYGASGPPRPFFRNMIADKSPGWGVTLGKLMVHTDYDADKSLAMMGESIRGELQESIRNFTSPPLADSTVAAKGFAKPLIDTAHMLNSVTYQVDS